MTVKQVETPSHFSPIIPKLQIVWDSTSLRQLMFCPRSYELAMVEGWRNSNSADLRFGGYFAHAVEVYKKARLDGLDREQATLLAMKDALEQSWEEDECDCNLGRSFCHEECPKYGGKPWGGHYEEHWRCTGTEPFKNAKGNRAKCPWSHAGKWYEAPAPHTCGSCGSLTETVKRYVPEHKTKNRETLIRLVAWYCDSQPQDLNSGLRPIKFPNGTPAVELSWKMPLPFVASTGERYILAGHFDSLMTDGQENFVADNKTTAATGGLNKNYWQQYEVNIQVDVYDLAASTLFRDMNIKGVLIEGAHVDAKGGHFGIQPFYRTDARREELLKELEWWLQQAEKFAQTDYWPMSRVNCKICPFNNICNKEPAMRERYLKADFRRERWNPLKER